MREDTHTTDEAGARDHAAALGAHEAITDDAPHVVTPFCSVCQRGTKGYVCGPCAREASSRPMIGPVDTRCVWCQHGTGTHWHTHCWNEAHDWFDEESA